MNYVDRMFEEFQRIPIRMAAYNIVTALIDSREKETNHDEERKAHRN